MHLIHYDRRLTTSKMKEIRGMNRQERSGNNNIFFLFGDFFINNSYMILS